MKAVHVLETEDDRKWMAKAMKQLEKAAMRLLAVEERLDLYRNELSYLKGNEEADKILKSIAKAFPKITSVVSHVESFMDKVGEIKIEDDEDNTDNK